MAGTETKRIIELTEASTVQSGDFIAVDSNARGTKKVPTSALATSAALTAETNARTGADEQMSERMDGIEEQTALIQNPTKMLSGALCSFTDGAEMPAKSVIVNIEPQQSGTGTPSPYNVRQISGWESVNVTDAGKNLLPVTASSTTIYGVTFTVANDGTITVNGTATGNAVFYINSANDSIGVKAGNYIINGSPINGTWGTIAMVWGDYTISTSGDRNVNLSSDYASRAYIKVSNGQTANNLVFKPMIRLASDTDPTYEPYNGTTTPVNLGRTVYGADAEIVGGSLTDKMGMATFDGSEAWALDATVSGVTKFYITQSDMKKMNNYTSALIANNMTASRNGYTTDDVSYMSVTGYSGSVGNYIYIMSKGAETGITTVAQLKEWLASHNLQVVYPLEQPQTYQLTPTQINTLLGENNVWADSGDVEITYRRDISIVLENLENALNGSNSLNAMMMSAPTENTAEEPTEDEAEDDMR